MAITANHILSDIRNIATSGSNPVDFRIEDSQVLYWIDQIRSTLISQSIQKRQDISDIWLQPLNCLQLIEVDNSECCELTTNCKILRSELEVPNTIEFNGDNLIIRVEKPNGEIISKSTIFENKYSNNSKYTSNKSRWYLKNNYIYITNEDIIEFINIIGLFDSPSELSKYTGCNGNPCFNLNTNYPCSKKMAEQITDIILKKKIYPFLQLPQDNTNDNSNEYKQLPNTKNL